jgi:dienelactone hydrolase
MAPALKGAAWRSTMQKQPKGQRGAKAYMLDLAKTRMASWPVARTQIEEQTRALLGQLPKDRVDVQTKTVDELDYPGYVRRRVNYFVDGWERCSAWLFIPEGKEEAPAIVCCHQETTPYGKDEPAGLEGDSRFAFAQHFAELGYVTLATDCFSAGERRSGAQKPFEMKPYAKENAKISPAGKMLLDHLYAVDVLQDQKRVDPARIGVIGHGLGGFNALMLAALDDRVQACVASCGFTRIESAKNPGGWPTLEGLPLLPGLAAAPEGDGFPYDWEHIMALAAPSPMLVMTSLSDTPIESPRSCDKAIKNAAKVYKVLGAKSAIEHFTHHDGYYAFSREALEKAEDWFERWL